MVLALTTTGQIGSNNSLSRQGMNTQYHIICSGKQSNTQSRETGVIQEEESSSHGHLLTAACMVVLVDSNRFVSGKRTAHAMQHHLELGDAATQ